MATKTTKGRCPELAGLTRTLALLAQGSDTIAASYSVTLGTYGAFSASVTESLSGWYDALLTDGTVVEAYGKLYYPSDTAGTYYVDDPKLLTDVKAKTDLIGTGERYVRQEDEIDSNTIVLKVGSTKAKTVPVQNAAGDDIDLTGKTLLLHIRTMADVFVESLSVTESSGSFTFTPSSTIAASVNDYRYALREPSNGNEPIVDGILSVRYAADGE